MNTEIEWKEKSEGVLVAIFPNSIPTHSRIQEFRFDKNTGLLVQHNYTADVISTFAKAVNVPTEHSEINGFKYPSRRLVTPMSFQGKPFKGPKLIDIIVHDLRTI